MLTNTRWYVLYNLSQGLPYRTNLSYDEADKAYLWCVNNEYIKDGKLTLAGDDIILKYGTPIARTKKMSVSIEFVSMDGEDGPYELCSASQWKEFSEWVEATKELPLQKIKVLCNEGYAEDTKSLAEELQATIDSGDLLDKYEQLVQDILDHIGVGATDEVSVITM